MARISAEHGEPLYIQDLPSLRRFVADLERSPFVCIDTEFMRERTYYAKLCLVQISTDDVAAIVDPLALPDLEPLRGVLLDPNVVKVMHAASQDIEILYRLFGEVPAPVFDTQVAATLAGFASQTGYGVLVGELLDKRLDKGDQFTDWSARPLTESQTTYALDDVLHLPALYHELRVRLEGEGRLEWLEPDLKRLTDPATYDVVPEEQWRRIKRASSLNRRQLGVLQHVTAWREREAQRRDLPKRRVMSDESLLEVARRAPKDMTKLRSIRGITEGMARQFGSAVLAAVQAGTEMPEDRLPSFPKRKRLIRDVDGAVDLMGALVRLRAKEHGVAVTLLASRADLEALAGGDREGSPLLEGWRRGIVGEELLRLLDGKLSLRLSEGGLVVDKASDTDKGR